MDAGALREVAAKIDPAASFLLAILGLVGVLCADVSSPTVISGTKG